MKITLEYSRQDEFNKDYIYIHKNGKNVADGYYLPETKEWYSDDCGIETASSEAEFIKRIAEYFSNKEE